MTKLARVQKDYLAAKASLEAASAIMKAAESVQNRSDRFDTPEYQKFSAAYQALAQAETALIQWGEGKIKHMPGYSAKMADLFQKVITYEVGPDVRQQMIDLTMKLSA